MEIGNNFSGARSGGGRKRGPLLTNVRRSGSGLLERERGALLATLASLAVKSRFLSVGAPPRWIILWHAVMKCVLNNNKKKSKEWRGEKRKEKKKITLRAIWLCFAVLLIQDLTTITTQCDTRHTAQEEKRWFYARMFFLAYSTSPALADVLM